MREIVLVGSVPLRPAAKVFETLATHLGTAAPFYPDGEQVGWVASVLAPLASNPQLQALYKIKFSETLDVATTFYRLAPGVRAKDLKLGPFRLGENAIASYKEFKRLKDKGVVPATTRFEMTVPSAGTLASNLHMLPQESFPLVAAALLAEIEHVLAVVPAQELLLQFDVPNETSFAEYERRPWAFNIPYLDSLHMRFEDGVEALGWLANQIPADVMIGIHTCSGWRIDAEADQDNRAIVEITNHYLGAIKRPLRYVHLPIHPTQVKPSDYAPLRDLNLAPETSLVLGLVNLSDKVEGAKRRIDAAEKAGVFDFGVSSGCGLGYGGDIGKHPFLEQATEQNIADVLKLHKDVAAL